MIAETASAKINLYLHVGPRRQDGLHELASLFVFAEKGDEISVAPAGGLALNIKGPYSAALSDLPPEKNLAWRAAALLKEQCGVMGGAAILLEKNLPIASGIGGGSADAAAALRALIRLWRIDISDEALAKLAFRLGADVPACLSGAPVNVSGAGERIEKAPDLPPLWVCLVNPGVDMPTGAIFRAFDEAHPAPPAPEQVALPARDIDALTVALGNTRNNLEPIARRLAPQIGAVIESIGACPGALMARMSGSGATCFGLFASAEAAAHAESEARRRNWWTLASRLRLR